MNKKRALGIVVAFVLAGGYWWISSRSQMPDGGGNGAINIADWKTYRNEEYGFEVRMPKEWTIRNIESSHPSQLEEAFRPLDPVLHFLSAEELSIFNSSSNTDKPFGFIVEVFPSSGVTLDTWLNRRFAPDSPLVDPQVTPIDSKERIRFGDNHDGYLIHQFGLAEGSYHIFFGEGEFIFSIITFSRSYLESETFQEILKSWNSI